MAQRLRWGIMGTGNIANQFAQGLTSSRRGVLAAVASRSRESAEAFVQKHNPKAVGVMGYDQLLERHDIDAIYLALPNPLHLPWTLKALQADKHVLCEKPIAVDSNQARQMFEQARQSGKVLAEGFMYRSHPLHHAIMKQIQEGAIGNVQAIRTNFCFKVQNIEGNIRFNRDLAGGALMDIGCYCVSLSRHYAQSEPTQVHVMSRLNDQGVDVLSTGSLHFPGDVLASFTCGMCLHADNAAYICGDEGYITIPVPWKPPVQKATYVLSRGIPPRMDQVNGSVTAGPMRKEVHIDAGLPVFALEADDFAAVVMDHAQPTISEADSIANMQVLDKLRLMAGVRFEGE
ncbi:MAG: Gfo/Idh/MocA family oxidoreductase, partial [Phycisphaeraceae bacterium]|nr:Gfo/Idh/MocA family oxidoreductase [Phycisphaeraceae bacterium]